VDPRRACAGGDAGARPAGAAQIGGRGMALTIGVVLALAGGLLFTWLRLDRERVFYPTITIVVASYYILFAVMGAPTRIIILESTAAVAFMLLALWGFRSSLWIVVAALAAHGLFDLVHDSAIPDPGVPGWWPGFCLGFDVGAAAYLAGLIASGRVGGRREPEPQVQ